MPQTTLSPKLYRLAEASSAVELTLSTLHTTVSWDDRDPDRSKFQLPLLYLHRQREETATADRTLEIRLSGIEGGSEIVVEAVSHHVNVVTGEPHMEATSFVLPDRLCMDDQPCTIRWTFSTATPTDLYYLRVKDGAGNTLWEDPQRPAFVMLDTWDVEVGDRQSQASVVRVTYATLFPFARGENDAENRLAPDAVTDFIEQQFAPIIRQTWHTQLGQWGFGRPLHPDWDADKVVEVIVTSPPFALFDGTGTYTVYLDPENQPSPERRIWWLSTHNALERYDSLANGYRALFAHEFFHIAQWNVLLTEGEALTAGGSNTGHLADYWTNTFIEAQAEFAASAQYPELELERSHLAADNSAYSSSANRFLAYRLNASYRELEADPTNKYDLALYWRFLYEQYGDMRIIHAALEEMMHHNESGIVGSMWGAMNAAFTRLDGPFHTFEESLIAFARANFALRLANGRCAVGGFADCNGIFYDPDRVYVRPPLEANLYFRGTHLTHDDAITSSYGMDFIKVHLDPSLQGEPMTIYFQGEGAGARFNLQIWKLRRGELEPLAVTAQPEIVPHIVHDNGSGAREYVIPSVDTTVYNQLGLIITRVDPYEAEAPVGEYHIVMESVENTADGDIEG